MAASMRRLFCSVSRLKSFKAISPIYVGRLSSYSDDSSDKGSTQSCLSPDGSCILFWHPEQNFPYEHTQPIPRKVKELEEADTVLKVQLLKEEEIKHRPDGPTDAELSNIFYETKHRWFPRPEKKYRKVNPPKDRDGL